jgi:hypothetical protein
MPKKRFKHHRNPLTKQQLERMPTWLVFMIYLTYLRAIQPQRTPEVAVIRTLIIVVGLVLTVVALVAAGAPNTVVDIIKHWPLIP